MAKTVSPGVQALRKVVEDVYADARKAKAEGKLVGWSSSKFPCELAEAFDLNVMYPENQAAGIAANRDGEIMCKAAEDLGFDNDICGYARISLAYAAGKRASRKVDLETGEYVINPNSGKPLKDENGNVVIDPETGKPKKDPKTMQPYTCWTTSMRSRPCLRAGRRSCGRRLSSPTARCRCLSPTSCSAATTSATA